MKRFFAVFTLCSALLMSNSAVAFAGIDRSLELRVLMERIQAGDASASSALILPDPHAWFGQWFGHEKGEELTNEYLALVKKAGGVKGITALISKQKAAGKTEVSAYIVDSRTASGLQRTAMDAATNERALSGGLALYSVRFTRPGAQRGFRLWSFAHDGQAFRLVGKMRALRNK